MKSKGYGGLFTLDGSVAKFIAILEEINIEVETRLEKELPDEPDF